MDDGLGQMTNIGTDLWQITIEPYAYYGLAPGTSINGLFMVFRNADGTQTGKDDLDNDIFLDLSGSTPTSAFSGVTAEWIEDGIDALLWSTGETTECITVDTSGIYSFSVTDTAGCTITDSILVTFTTATVDLGPDTNVCDLPLSITLDAGPGYSLYVWSNGALTQSITVTTPGAYSVFAQNAAGCIAIDTIHITSTPFTLDLGSDTTSCESSIILEPSASLDFEGDSLRIVYDATQGVSGLGSSAKFICIQGMN